jgi:ATP-dependent DNA ligase
VNRLKARSYLIDGEAVASDDNGVAVFARLRRKPSGRHVFLIACDLLELDAVSEELGCGRRGRNWRR